MAGGIIGSNNNNYYLYTGQKFWTGTSYSFDGYDDYAYEFTIGSLGVLNNYYLTSNNGVRPVISLSSKVKLSGNGTWNNVYEVS